MRRLTTSGRWSTRQRFWLDAQNRSIPARIPHAAIPTAGSDSLVGANVVLGHDRGSDWELANVLGREPTVDPSSVLTPVLNLILPSDTVDVSPDLDTPVTGMVQFGTEHGIPGRPDEDGRVDMPGAGVYHLVGTVAWSSADDGTRHAVLERRDNLTGTESVLRRIQVEAVGSLVETDVQVVVLRTLPDATAIRLSGKQDSGLLLDIRGVSFGNRTALDIVRLSPARARTAAPRTTREGGGPGTPRFRASRAWIDPGNPEYPST